MNTRIFIRETKNNIYLHLDITGNGLRLKMSSGIMLNSVKDWNEKSGEIKGNDLNALACNKKIFDIKQTIKKLESDCLLLDKPLTPELLKEGLIKVIAPERIKEKEEVQPKTKKINNLLQYVEWFIKTKPINQSDSTYEAKEMFLVNIKHYADKYGVKTLDFENIDYTFFTSFKKFLYEVRNHKISTAKKYITDVHIFMNSASDNGFNTCLKYKIKSCSISKLFTKVENAISLSDTIYLTEEEVDALYELAIEDPRLSLIRYWFVFGCLTGLRFSDVQLLNDNKRKGFYISFKSKKTGNKVIAPLRKRAAEILLRYKNEFPKIGKSEFNIEIKEICSRIPSLKVKIDHNTTNGGKLKTEKVFKYELVMAHTGRRTFATDAMKRGIPVNVIMDVTGHKTIQSFMKYIRIDTQESAELIYNVYEKIDRSKAA